MSIERAKTHLKKYGADGRILEFSVSSATVALAAAALHTQEAQIAKTLSFNVNDAPVLIVCAGDTKIDNRKYKDFFHTKAKMLSPEEAETLVGHAVGGVCPFGVNPNVRIYLDESLKRFETVFPACGSSNSAIELTPEELHRFAEPEGWIDVCKIPE